MVDKERRKDLYDDVRNWGLKDKSHIYRGPGNR